VEYHPDGNTSMEMRPRSTSGSSFQLCLRLRHPRLIDLAAVRPGEHVLDVACGTGVVTRLAAERVGSTGLVVGLDTNPSMPSVARESVPAGGVTVEWLEASALEMPLPNAAFDVVLCQTSPRSG
jgi:ubiquinone/menaquinone biosynthesis C-methylase UbiE